MTHASSERPPDVARWCATWDAMRATRIPALCEVDVLAWIETLEATVDAQRVALRELREVAAQEAAE